MPKFKRPCSSCGIPSSTTLCPECTKVKDRMKIKKHNKKAPARARGYDYSWDKLSKLARKMQPFCVDCGSSEHLQADHSPKTWERKEKGLPLRPIDVDVVCRSCNIKRGAARGEQVFRT